MAQEAFDLAEQFQTPIFVMMDLDLGMNNWMSDAFKYPTKPINRGKLLTAEKLKELGEWGRYKDVDGDGIPYRTIPGDGMPVVLHARLRPQRQGPVQRAARRLRREHGPAVAQVRDRAHARAEAGGQTNAEGEDRAHRLRHVALRDRGEPRSAAARRPRSRPRTSGCARIRSRRSSAQFIDAHERVYVIEQNRDAQLLQLMKLELTPDRQKKLRSVLHYNGLPIDARSITDDVLAQEGFEVAKKDGRRGMSAGTAGGE